MILSAPILNGKANFNQKDEQDLKQYLMSQEGKTLWFTVDERRPPKTLAQLGYLWGHVYKVISDETGQTEEEIHDFCKEKFLPRMWTVENGREVELPKSISRCNTKEMNNFIERVRAYFASEYGITTDDPKSIFPEANEK